VALTGESLVPFAVAFDIYGTVVDPGGIVAELAEAFGARAGLAARMWREKQLEFTFRRALMDRYVDFDTCTDQALRHVGGELGVELTEARRRALLDAYLRLPAYPEAKRALETLRAARYRIVALTNGTEKSVRTLLEHAGIDGFFEMILSADSIRTFKPDPAVYDLLKRSGVPAEQVWLVSGNPFDVIGAKAHGLKAAWVRRDTSRIFDPWEFAPDAVIGNLQELSQAIPRA
jgi:2-haloacid dehalogenase